jgi:hypothetical protein
MAKSDDSTPTDKAAAARLKNLDLALQQIEKDYGSEAIRRLGDAHVGALSIAEPTAGDLSVARDGGEVALAAPDKR